VREIEIRAKRKENGSVSTTTIPINQERLLVNPQTTISQNAINSEPTKQEKPLGNSQTNKSQNANFSQPRKPQMTFEEELRQKVTKNAQKKAAK